MLTYADGIKISNIIDGASKATLIADIETALNAAGWTTVSGHLTTDIKFHSVVTGSGNQIKIRVWDGGSTCVRIRMMNTAETIAQTDSCYLLPAVAKSFKIIANQHQFFVFCPGSIAPRDSVFVSSLYIPAHLTISVTTLAIILGDGGGDADTTVRGGFRRSLNAKGVAGSAPAQGWTLINSVPVEYAGLTADGLYHPGLPSLVVPQAATFEGVSGYRWVDDSVIFNEPLIGWGEPTIEDELKVVGQLWDAAVCSDSVPMDQPTIFDGHNWQNITNNNVGRILNPSGFRGSIFLVVP